MPKPITAKDILRQLKADLIGKDSYRGVTLSYSWLANQTGHFALGFIPSFILYLLLKKYTSMHNPALWSAVIISCAWFLFELYNFLGPLLLNKPSASKLLYIPGRRAYVFTPAWKNIAFDTFTDVLFFALGAFTLSILLSFSWGVVTILVILIVVLALPSHYWYVTKMFLQEAVYPFQFRLSQWDLVITPGDKATVYRFLGNRSTGKHLLIFGGRETGKTSLAVGICTELSIKHRTCFYTTGVKLYHLFFAPADKQLQEDEGRLWTWRKSSCLVIDDINPGDPVKEDIISPAEFLDILDTFKGAGNRDTLKQKNVIWVMGTQAKKDSAEMQWKAMVRELGVSDEDISTVQLNSARASGQNVVLVREGHQVG